MIKRFHVLYVGQIDLDNVGINGTPANDRRYPNERLSEVFFTTRDMARVMDDLGYYALWTAEHHFQREGYECLPNLVQLGLWLATQTKRLKFGCAFNVLPMWHPIRLAEDYAMADIVTDGRIIMGVGRGYHTREVETFGAPLIDADKNREYFEEQLQLLLPASTRSSSTSRASISRRPPEVEYRGYNLTDITMVPRPKHLPVEVWMPVASGKTIDMMAKYGLKAMVTLNGEKILDDVVRAYQGHAQSTASRSSLARTWSGAPACISLAARKRRSAGSSRRTTNATNGSRRSGSCATRTSRAAPGERRARRRKSRHCATGCSRRRGSVGRPAR